MIKKEAGSGTPSAITWKVVLNKGSLKADMTGYTFTDRLDGKQTYIGNYAGLQWARMLTKLKRSARDTG